MANQKSTKVLELVFGEGTSDRMVYEMHLLNPGDAFPAFGGSRHALVAKKTASLVLRRKGFDICDTEYDLRDASVWEWFEGLLKEHGIKFNEVDRT